MVDEVEQDEPLTAGPFGAWLAGVQGALAGEGESDVPCGGCTACCRSSQFVHVGPDEADALAHIPSALLFPAPQAPPGTMLLGYDEQGRCPMLGDAGCTIYEHRPRTCRTYDCRVYPAAGLGPGPEQPAVAARAQRWRFEHPTDDDRTLHDAVVAAARFVREHPERLPESRRPPGAAQEAVLAIRLHRAFVARDADGRRALVQPSDEAIAAALQRPDAT